MLTPVSASMQLRRINSMLFLWRYFAVSDTVQQVNSNLASAQRNKTSASTEYEKEEANIQIEVLEALQAALKQQ